MSGTLALAASIAAMDRSQLERLLTDRSAPQNADDPLSLASELLRPDSILRALSRLPKPLLRILHRDDTNNRDAVSVRELKNLGLLGMSDGAPIRLPEVTEALELALSGKGGKAALDPPSEGKADVQSPDSVNPDTSHWFAQALTATSHIAECVRTLSRHPGKLNRNGSIAVATARTIAELARITEREAMLSLTILRECGFLREREREFTPSSAGTGWLTLPHAERWVEIATRVISAAPSPLQDGFSDHALAVTASTIPARYPLLPDSALATVDQSLNLMEYLGITVQGHLSAPALALITNGDATSIAVNEMPPTAPGVYVQPDLSVIIPGPLDPADEAFLTELSESEQPGVASTRRITEATLHSAFERGLSPSHARETLARLSLTGVPQPLEYLLTAASERVGTIVVDVHHGDEGRTSITAATPGIAETLVADRALQHLQLHRLDETTLVAKLRPDHVLAALSDARHPALLATQTAQPDDAPAARSDPAPHDYAAQATRIIEAAQASPGDFTRRLELAIRDRANVTVTVNTGGDPANTREFTVLPISLDAGRLRALDQAAGVERTFPVSLIVDVD